MALTGIGEIVAHPGFIAAMGAGLAFFVVLGFGLPLTGEGRVARRLKAVSDRAQGRAPAVDEAAARGAGRGLGLIRWLVVRLNLLREPAVKGLAHKLARAGWRRRDALLVYLFFKACLPLAAAALGAAALYGLDIGRLAPFWRLVALLAIVLGAAMLPDLVVRRAQRRRRHVLRRALPDALDLLVICAEAGLSVDAALDRVAREIAPSAPALAEELALASLELALLPVRRQAFDRLRERVGLPAVDALVTTIQQSEEFGTPLANALRVLASQLRHERMMRAEERAARLPAIMTVPLILFVLPALFVVVIGPAVIGLIGVFARL